MSFVRLLPAVLLLSDLPITANASNATFARLRDQARPVASLTTFLDKYVGGCAKEAKKCSGAVRKFRSQADAETHYLILDDKVAQLMRPAGFNPATREFNIEITPFFEAGGRALTEGAPRGQDAQGRPRIPLMRLVAKLPNDWMPMDMDRLLRTGNVRVQLVFKTQGVWSLPGTRRGERLEGVKAKMLAVRLTNRRNGDQLALHLAD